MNKLIKVPDTVTKKNKTNFNTKIAEIENATPDNRGLFNKNYFNAKVSKIEYKYLILRMWLKRRFKTEIEKIDIEKLKI